jgi:methylthioribose-1-phosphate isomerase
VVILDQTRLPEEQVELELRTADDLVEAIRALRVRGAPLIGITAAMGLAALGRQAERAGIPRNELIREARDCAARLMAARPTAVNLAWAVKRLERVLGAPTSTDSPGLARRLAEEAEAIRSQDARMCRRIGEHGLALLGGGHRVLTHCNAGVLATGGIGTALAPVYLARERGMSVRVLVGETRPLLQGSRLTAWELGQAGIEVTVLTDGATGALFRLEPPDVVLVGADRIAANGDVANKVGTYSLAILARHHGVPFYVLAPTSSVDLEAETGSDIPIEHRAADEVRRGFGRTTTPEHAAVWNPAFDVTPADLVTAIVTEQGICRPPYRSALRDAASGVVEPDR